MFGNMKLFLVLNRISHSLTLPTREISWSTLEINFIFPHIHVFYLIFHIHVFYFHSLFNVLFFLSIRLYPHHQDTGGFFIAVLQKKSTLPWVPGHRPGPKLLPWELTKKEKMVNATFSSKCIAVEQVGNIPHPFKQIQLTSEIVE